MGYVLATGFGVFLAFVAWGVTFTLVVPKGTDFTGYGESILMFVLLPVFMLVGGIAGALINARSQTTRSESQDKIRPPQGPPLSSILSPSPVEDDTPDTEGAEDHASLPLAERARRYREGS